MNTLTNKTVKCLSACSTTYYNSITASTSSFPDPRIFLNTVHSCTLASKLVNTCKDFRRTPLEESYPGENLCWGSRIMILHPFEGLCALIEWLEQNKALCIEGR